ncbi:MAG: pyridine nucleotide-disulfide oxidoreductase [Gammaproteobacteria bacterium]
MSAAAEKIKEKQALTSKKPSKKAVGVDGKSPAQKKSSTKAKSAAAAPEAKKSGKQAASAKKAKPAAEQPKTENKVSAKVASNEKSLDPLHLKPKRNPTVFIISAIVLGIIMYGWYVAEDSYITPEEGIGYWLGIVGGMAMLLLLSYPLRKKWRPMRKMGKVKYWFRVHMFLGLLGPILVLFHANFSLGSINSTVAFFSMLLVAGSGVIGKYFYLKIHYGLYGKHATMDGLKDDLQLTKGMLGKHISLSEQMKVRLEKYERAVTKKHGFIVGFIRIPVTYILSKWMLYSVLHEVKIGITKYADAKGWDKKLRAKLYNRSKADFTNYIFHSKKVAEFTIYEQLFSLWHILHYPLFIALVFSGIAHVFAVHIF